jgi:hypothetical protein
MKLAELDVCTPEMARKEFYAGLLAYSLVRAVMWAAENAWKEAAKHFLSAKHDACCWSASRPGAEAS